MNKTAIKNFAVWARRKLISEITYKAEMIGVSANGILEPLPNSTKDLQLFDVGTKDYAEVSGEAVKQRSDLVAAIRAAEKGLKYSEAFENVIEEVAYTWFNRLIAIRFMEVNDYLPSGVRVLSSENSAKNEPDFVTTPFDTDLEFAPYEQDKVLQLKDENKLDELFRMLFIKQCNKLHEILPELFEKTNDYTELLLTLSFTDKDGVVYHLVHDIDEDDFNVEKEGQVEIIGWMYQYYISEKHDEIINIYKGTVKKDDIPAATQLFTTDWVVRYMVDNSLGRYWIERNPDSKLAEKLAFFVTPKNGEIKYIDEKIEPTELTLFDPCMGSGHILVYAFDVLMEIYLECGYTEREAALNIIQYNLHGLDIDKRAYQLAYFAVMMKAREYDRRFFSRNIQTKVLAIEESGQISNSDYLDYCGDEKATAISLLTAFKNGKECGSIINLDVSYEDVAALEQRLITMDKMSDYGTLDVIAAIGEVFDNLYPLVRQAKLLLGKYTAVVTNPPYMNKMESHLKDFVVTYYKEYSGDLFSVFMYRNFGFCKKDGYSAFMTPFVWMFIKTYEHLRNFIINNKSITSLIQMEYSAFEEATVPICSFVLKNGKDTNKALCFRLSDFKGGMEVQKQKVLEALANKNCGYFYETEEENFSKIPGTPISYWISQKAFNICEQNRTFEDYATTRAGMITGNNNLFMRLWHEVSASKFGTLFHSREEAQESKKKWFPYNKGGEFRKWYGNNEYVVNWENDGFFMRNFTDDKGKIPAHAFNLEYIFKENVTWSSLSSYKYAARYTDFGFLYDASGSFADIKRDNLYYTLAFLCSNVTAFYLSAMNPTLNFQKGNIASLPFILEASKMNEIDNLTKSNICYSKSDWDAFETSWDFRKHPLVPLARERQEQEISQFANSRMEKFGRISWHYEKWEQECTERFNKLKANEEELNRIFIEIYGLQDELTPEVEDKDVTVHYIADTKEDAPESMRGSNYLLTRHDVIKSFISYAVGCMLGRYSLDADGLAFAGGEWDGSKYKTYLPDDDNCIPITDEEYFGDDIVGRFVEFIKVVYGEETLEANLDFIADALNTKHLPLTAREVIRKYFLNDFCADHIKTYQKRPIYWLFDSGKQNGFKALCYMHRYNADTIGNMRIEYLHRVQRVYEKEIERMQEIIDNSTNAREVSSAEKRKDKLTKQLKETKDYDEKVAHLALSRIDIDLDDGVKVNYEKVQTAQDGRKLEMLAKI